MSKATDDRCMWGQDTSAPCTLVEEHEGDCSTEMARVQRAAHGEGYEDGQSDAESTLEDDRELLRRAIALESVVEWFYEITERADKGQWRDQVVDEIRRHVASLKGTGGGT